MGVGIRHGEISRDRAKIHELYAPDWKMWFGDEGDPRHGTPDDPRIVLIGVTVHGAEPLRQARPVMLFELVKGYRHRARARRDARARRTDSTVTRDREWSATHRRVVATAFQSPVSLFNSFTKDTTVGTITVTAPGFLAHRLLRLPGSCRRQRSPRPTPSGRPCERGCCTGCRVASPNACVAGIWRRIAQDLGRPIREGRRQLAPWPGWIDRRHRSDSSVESEPVAVRRCP